VNGQVPGPLTADACVPLRAELEKEKKGGKESLRPRGLKRKKKKAYLHPGARPSILSAIRTFAKEKKIEIVRFAAERGGKGGGFSPPWLGVETADFSWVLLTAGGEKRFVRVLRLSREERRKGERGTEISSHLADGGGGGGESTFTLEHSEYDEHRDGRASKERGGRNGGRKGNV